MKSVLHEASSILKAIEKAWEASGKPSEFNVKVLEQGERKFLFFTNKPSIVSISFDPKHVSRNTAHNSNRNKQLSNRNNNATQEKLLNGTSPQLDSVARGNPRNRPQQSNRKQGQQSINPKKPVNTQQRQPQQQSQARQGQTLPRQTDQGVSPSDLSSGWTQELAQFTIKELKDILNIMGITVPFQEKIDQKTLTIVFSQPPLENKEDARLLYISLSYLLIQLTKKQEKKKLRGFHLVITSN